MRTKKRRAPSADWLAMTPADRQAVRQSRLNAQSSRYRADIRAITNGDALAKPAKDLK